MNKVWKKITTTTRRTIATLLGMVIATIIWGCSTTTLVPTVVPPLMDQLIEGDTPHIPIQLSTNMPPIKLTVQGVVDARMEYLERMYPVVKNFYDAGRATSEKTGQVILGLMATAGLGGAGALPWALNRLPKGAVRKEEHEEIVRQEREKAKTNLA